jgi:hypothetical protein
MRGDDRPSKARCSANISPEQRVPADHPLRPIRQMVDEVLHGLSQVAALYATGRECIAPEKLLWALLLQLCYSVRRSNWPTTCSFVGWWGQQGRRREGRHRGNEESRPPVGRRHRASPL